MQLFKRLYPKNAPVPKVSEQVSFDEYWKQRREDELRRQNEPRIIKFLRMVWGIIYALCFFLCYIPFGVYSVLCGGYFFGGPLAGGAGGIGDPEDEFPSQEEKGVVVDGREQA